MTNTGEVPTEGDIVRDLMNSEVPKRQAYQDIEARKKQIEAMPEGPLKNAMLKGIGDWSLLVRSKKKKGE